MPSKRRFLYAKASENYSRTPHWLRADVIAEISTACANSGIDIATLFAASNSLRGYLPAKTSEPTSTTHVMPCTATLNFLQYVPIQPATRGVIVGLSAYSGVLLIAVVLLSCLWRRAVKRNKTVFEDQVPELQQSPPMVMTHKLVQTYPRASADAAISIAVVLPVREDAAGGRAGVEDGKSRR
jgi:hypothetical protein